MYTDLGALSRIELLKAGSSIVRLSHRVSLQTRPGEHDGTCISRGSVWAPNGYPTRKSLTIDKRSA
jgi:hypothetical protein